MPSWICRNLTPNDCSVSNEAPIKMKFLQKSPSLPQFPSPRIDSSLSSGTLSECCDPVHPRIRMKIKRVLRPTWSWTVEQVDVAHPTRLIFRRISSFVEDYVITENEGLTKEDLEEIANGKVADSSEEDSSEEESVSISSISPPPKSCTSSLSSTPSSLTSPTGSLPSPSSDESILRIHPVTKRSPSPTSVQEDFSNNRPISPIPSAQVQPQIECDLPERELQERDLQERDLQERDLQERDLQERDLQERRRLRQIRAQQRALHFQHLYAAAAAERAELKARKVEEKRRRLRAARIRQIRAKYGCKLGDRLRAEMEIQTEFYRKWFWFFYKVQPVNLKDYRIPSGHSGQGHGVTFNPMDISNTTDQNKAHYTSSSEETTFCSRVDKSKPKQDSVVAHLWRELVAERRGQGQTSSSSYSDLALVKSSSSPATTPTPSSDCGENEPNSLFCGVESHSSSSPVPDWLMDMSQEWKGWNGVRVGQHGSAPHSPARSDDSEVDLDILIITHDENDVLPMPSPFVPIGIGKKTNKANY